MADFNLSSLCGTTGGSGSFYADLLGKAPVEASPLSSCSALATPVSCSASARHTVEPAATLVGGGELAITVDDVDAVHADWSGRGLPIIQADRHGFWPTFRGVGTGMVIASAFSGLRDPEAGRKAKGFYDL